MSRNGKIILLVLLAAAGLSVAAVAARRGDPDHPVARITWDGEVVEEIELDRVGRAYSFVLEDERGSNTIAVERGRIRVSQADCPDQVCVDQGWIADGTVPIVCLPHKLVIEIVGGGSAFDAAAG